jgi:hypothetical protein
MLRLAALALATFVVVAGTTWFAMTRSQPAPLDSPPLRGVRLGMGLEDARARFTDGEAGSWSSPPGCCGTTLEWTRGDAHATQTRWARFEFQQGVVVAIRLLSDASPPTARRIEVTPAAVTEVRPGADRSTSATVLALRSETHRGEVRQLVTAAVQSSD